MIQQGNKDSCCLFQATTTGHFGNQKPRAYKRKQSHDPTDSQEEDTPPAEDQVRVHTEVGWKVGG